MSDAESLGDDIAKSIFYTAAASLLFLGARALCRRVFGPQATFLDPCIVAAAWLASTPAVLLLAANAGLLRGMHGESSFVFPQFEGGAPTYEGVPVTASAADIDLALDRALRLLRDDAGTLRTRAASPDGSAVRLGRPAASPWPRGTNEPSDGTFFRLLPSQVDPRYALQAGVGVGKVRCRFVPTESCVPSGVAAFEEAKDCKVTVPSGAAGFCECPNGELWGKACAAAASDRGFHCNAVCSSRGATEAPVRPGHRELTRRFQSNRDDPARRPNSVVLTLTRAARLPVFVRTLRNFETAFNNRYGYPYLVLFDPTDSFSAEYRDAVVAATTAPVTFSNVPEAHWAVPSHIVLANVPLEPSKKIPHMSHLSYRQMCRFFSGFFYRQEALKNYDYFWRLDDDVTYLCGIYYDPFVLMARERKVYGFVMVNEEFMATIPSLYNTTKEFIDESSSDSSRPEGWTDRLVAAGNYTGCHFWSNFEIGSLRWFRENEGYTAFFEHLDRSGGFFYERWGDAPVRTLGLSLLTELDQLYYFESVAYAHSDSYHVPADTEVCGGMPLPDRAMPTNQDEMSTCTHPFAHLAQLRSQTTSSVEPG
ncbi:Glycolipid 2-alpha-mannosyltransferase 1 [Diplonema papillatum]|nr:Glycolipid 2-alpha-mannosyltransferase 1 [Diplonema papillatum]KAJ9449089.1 Glycolipid 2-alpha-mannosyltransferase 1 [Diplonema papillatum]